MKEKSVNRKKYCCAILLTSIILMFAMIKQNLFPFGDKNFFLWDMDIQYKNIYCWFYDVLHSNASLFYDFSKSLGGNMYSVFAVYLASPINLLVYFFPPEKITYFITLATVIKIVLCSFFCCIYLNKRWKIDSCWMIAVLSSAYALMEYNVSLCSNLHFLDGIYILPIIALGVYYIVEQQKGWILTIGVAYCLFCNWYIGYICCFFSIFYFLFELTIKKRSWKNIWKAFYRYVWYMILGVLGGCITFIPSILASVNGKGNIDLSLLKEGFHCRPYIPLKALYINSLGNVNYEEPAIYVSGIVYVLVCIFLFNKSITKREKMVSIVFLLLLFLSFSFVPLEIMWTMLKKTWSFHFRYSFVFSFLLILVGAMCWERLEAKKWILSKKYTIVIVALIGILGFWGAILVDDHSQLGIKLVFVGLTLLFAILVSFLFCVKKEWLKNGIIAIIICIFVGELTYNTSSAFKRYQLPNQNYEAYYNAVDEIIDDIIQNDNSFYRIEKTISSLTSDQNPYPVTATEALMFNYNAITHYSSLYDSTVNDYVASLGYCRKNSMWTNYCDTNIVADTLLGVKYVITDETPAYMDLVETNELPRDNHLYKNSYALPLGILVDSKISNPEYVQDPFANQETVLSEITGDICSIYADQEIIQTGTSEWNIKVKNAGAVYLYFNGSHPETKLFVNGIYKQPWFTRAYTNIVYLGMHDIGDVIQISFDEENCEALHNIHAVTLDEQQFFAIIDNLKENSFEPSVIKDGFMKGTYKADGAGLLMLSIPYDEGWQLTVNGEKTKYEKVLDSMIAIPIEKGKSEIQLEYKTPFLKLGVFCSIMGIILLIFSEFYYMKSKQ